MYLGCPPKLCINIVSKFSCDDCIWVLQNYGGEGGQTRYKGDEQMEKWKKEFYSGTLIERGAKRQGKFVNREKLF